MEELIQNAAKTANLPRLLMAALPGNQRNPAAAEAIQREFSSTTSSLFNVKDLYQYRAICADVTLPAIVHKDTLLRLNDANVNLCCDRKDLFHNACMDAEQSGIRPQTWLIDRAKPFNPSLVQKILSEAPACKCFVIKSPNIDEGKGLIFVTREQLNDKIQLLQISRHSDSPDLSQFDLNEQNMFNDDSNMLLVETYVSSQPHFQDGKIFDVTYRQFFFMIRTQQKWTYVPIDSYGRLPSYPITDKTCQFRELAIPSFSDDRKTVTPIPEAEQTTINQQLAQAFPAIMKQMITLSMEKIVNPSRAKPEQAFNYLFYANNLGSASEFELAELCLKRAELLSPQKKRYRVFHERGVLFNQQQRYHEAIAAFTTALEQRPKEEIGFVAPHHRRAIAYHYVGNYQARDADLRTAGTFAPKRVVLICTQLGIPIPKDIEQLAMAEQQCVIS